MTVPKTPVASYFNQWAVLYCSTLGEYAYDGVNCQVRWEDITKEAVDLAATYQPVTGIVSYAAFVPFSSLIPYYWIKDTPFQSNRRVDFTLYKIMNFKMVPGVEGVCDHYQYYVQPVTTWP